MNFEILIGLIIIAIITGIVISIGRIITNHSKKRTSYHKIPHEEIIKECPLNPDWKCPLCSKVNNSSLLKCSCGYEKSSDDFRAYKECPYCGLLNPDTALRCDCVCGFLECPHCGLLNPDTALRCDCGYDFETNKIEGASLIQPEQILEKCKKKQYLDKVLNSPVSKKIILEVLLGVVILIVGWLFLIQGNTKQDIANQLRESGKVTTGTVIYKRVKKNVDAGYPTKSIYYTYHITYCFENNRQVTQNVSELAYQKFTLKGGINIRYLPQNPLISEIDGTEMWQGRATFTKVIGFIITVVFIVLSVIRLPICLKWIKFLLMPKATTQATISARARVEKKEYKDQYVRSRYSRYSKYSYYIIYSFKTPEQWKDCQLFYFREKVSKTLYDRMKVGMSLIVEYALTNPRLAHRKNTL